MQIISRSAWVFIIVGSLLVASCKSTSYRPISVRGAVVEMTSAWDGTDQSKSVAIAAYYKQKVDEMMLPVVGRCAVNMEAKRPESLLSNLVADVLREATIPFTGRPADMAIINIGGLRNSLNKGNITFGNIYEVLPFENTLCIVYIKGKNLRELMQNIINVGGEGVSNLELVSNANKEVVSAKIGGKLIEDERVYEVATVDYLAEGNDKMIALQKAESKTYMEGVTIRNIFLDYVKSLEAEGKEVNAKLEGRIKLNN